MLEEEFMHLAGKKAWMVERMYVEYFIQSVNHARHAS